MRKLSTVYWLLAVVAALAAALILKRFAIFVAPFAWTGEPARLADVLDVQPGMHIADVGAGSGALALAMREFVGGTGLVYATELSSERRADIEQGITRASAGNVRVVAAAEAETGLPERCCDAIYMRAVFHHIGARARFAAAVGRALRPGGRVAVIDFPPGALWFHGPDHGVQPDSVLSAFETAGLRARARIDDWGGGMFLVLFEAP